VPIYLGSEVVVLSQLRSRAGRTIRNFKRVRSEGVGHDFFADIRTRLPHLQILTIFDVGAHIGITALAFSDEFPNADVYAFEPAAANFARMKANLVGKPETKLFLLGFSSEPGEGTLMCEPEHPSMARLVHMREANTENVKLDTIDQFCAETNVAKIDLLKIDVEGHELNVLSGARGMLKDGRISIVKAETAIDPDLQYHVQLFDLCEFMHPLGYRLFAFYDQWESTLVDKPALRRFDAVFISPEAQTR
jgi:FkbM family methyltransferase